MLAEQNEKISLFTVLILLDTLPILTPGSTLPAALFTL
jgi:hypothetical protein